VSFHTFPDRQTRINRREERNLFRRRLLPLAWAICGLGAFGLLGTGGYYFVTGDWPRQLGGIFVALAILPFTLLAIAFLRGHHSRHLDEP
jgi:hypothetical protein